jgi:hypothetical protein
VHYVPFSNKVSQKTKKQILHYLRPLKKQEKNKNKNFREILSIYINTTLILQTKDKTKSYSAKLKEKVKAFFINWFRLYLNSQEDTSTILVRVLNSIA